MAFCSFLHVPVLSIVTLSRRFSTVSLQVLSTPPRMSARNEKLFIFNFNEDFDLVYLLDFLSYSELLVADHLCHLCHEIVCTKGP